MILRKISFWAEIFFSMESCDGGDDQASGWMQVKKVILFGPQPICFRGQRMFFLFVFVGLISAFAGVFIVGRNMMRIDRLRGLMLSN